MIDMEMELGVDPPFVSPAEQVSGPGHAQVFGAAFNAAHPFDGETAGGGEAAHSGSGIDSVAGGKGVGFDSAAQLVDELMEAVRVSRAMVGM